MPNVYEVGIASNEFGETYHIAAAMVLSRFCTDNAFSHAEIRFRDESDQGKMSEEQQAFLEYIKIESGNTGSGPTGRISKASLTEDFIAPCLANSEAIEKLREILLAQLRFHDNLREKVTQYISETKRLDKENKKAAIWIRKSAPAQDRDTTKTLINQVITTIYDNDITQVLLFGDDVEGIVAPRGVGVTGFQKFFQDFKYKDCFDDKGKLLLFAMQLYLFNLLQEDFNLVLAVGMKSGAMDGPAFLGLPTIFFDLQATADSRMGKVAAQAPALFKRIVIDESSYKKNSSLTIKENGDLDKKIKQVIN